MPFLKGKREESVTFGGQMRTVQRDKKEAISQVRDDIYID